MERVPQAIRKAFIAIVSVSKLAHEAGALALAVLCLVISPQSSGQDRLSEDAVHERWFVKQDQCEVEKDEEKQENCWDELVSEMMEHPTEFESYMEKRQKRAWEAGERNNWQDDPCKLSYYAEFSFKGLEALDQKESAELEKCLASQQSEDN